MLNNPDFSTLVWADEFNVDGLPDPTKWSYDLGDSCDIGLCNWGNSEVAYYTNNLSNVYVSNGTLSIVAKQESGYSLPYTSARIVTRGKHSFKYGRVQFRANLSKSKARGTWPALWMLPEYSVYGGWPRSGEIDVMEAVGHQRDRFFGTIHTEAYNGMIGTQKGGSISVRKENYHVFEVNWEEDKIQFAVDQQIYFEYPRGDSTSVWPFDQEFHLIMNIAVGGTWGGQQGIDSDAFNGSGQVMEVDWVRVYGEATPTSSPVSSINPSNNFCGCSSCTKEVWDAIASDSAGNFTCGGRITWLQSSAGGSMSEFDACRQIAGQEFMDGPCGPYCNPSTCI
jgi:beta-glucanase (GH16 family)